MKLFVISLTYIQPLEVVEQYLVAHRDFLDIYYREGQFLASGPKNPRDGGIIIARADNQIELEEILSNDPFFKHDIAQYSYTEFEAVKKANCLETW